MPLTIAHAAVTAQVAAAAPPPTVAAPTKAGGTKAVAPSPSQTVADTAHQQAALRQLLTKYSYDQAHGIDATTLSNLGKQIMAAAKALGQHVTLPHAQAASGGGEATSSTASSVPQKGRVRVTA